MNGPLTTISWSLSKDLKKLKFGAPVTHVYDPLQYAWRPHESYLGRFGTPPKEVVLLGMNPGPFGMAQTGVPFGEVDHVQNWLGIQAKVDKPHREHPKRPIDGFDCRRSEVSGRRLWGLAKARFISPASFFARFFVVNYCPLVFMEESGRNRTPDKLPKEEREALFSRCDRALIQIVETLRPRWVVGIGRFAETRARGALEGGEVGVGGILHPSPASPAANRGWSESAERELSDLGIQLPPLRQGRADEHPPGRLG